MKLDDQVTPEKEEFVDFIKNYPSGIPVTMINILKFRALSGNGDETGKEAYLRYSKNMAPLLSEAGGEIIWMGKVTRTIIGDYQGRPDMVLLVRYPSKEAFIKMSTRPEYEEISKDRKIALEYGGLLSAQTISLG